MNGEQNETNQVQQEGTGQGPAPDQMNAQQQVPPPQYAPPGGYQQPYYQEPPRGRSGRRSSQLPYKSPALATIFSGLFPGLGHVYLGYIRQGFQNMLIMAAPIVGLASGLASGLEPLFGIFLGFFYFYNMIDANRRANHINLALDGLSEQTLPDNFELPGSQGSLPTGVILIILGVLFILDLNFNVSMGWIEDWWPLALIGFGGWLVYKSRQEKGRG